MAIEQEIQSLIDDNNIILFMKGNRQEPRCGFSGMVIQILNHLGRDYQTCDVLESEEMRQGIKAFSNWPTVPQLYINREFVGGCDIVREMFEAGELNELLERVEV